MDNNLSRRNLLRAGAVGAVGGVAGCMEALPKSIQCRAGRPTTFTFTPVKPLSDIEFERNASDLQMNDNETDGEYETPDEELLLNKFVEILSTRARVGLDYEAIPEIRAAEVLDTGATSFEFKKPVSNTEPIEYIIGQKGTVEVTLNGPEIDETTLFSASGDYRRGGARAKRLATSGGAGNWISAIPLGPSEASELQQTLRDNIVVENASEYTFVTYFYGEQISESQLPQDGVEELLSEEWDSVLPISGLTRKQAVGLVAHSRSQEPPTELTIETSCRELEHHVDTFGNDSEG